MANEATVFSLTTTEQATGTAGQSGGYDVDIATANADAVTASIDIGLYFLKAKYDVDNGKTKLLEHINKIRDKIIASTWKPI